MSLTASIEVHNDEFELAAAIQAAPGEVLAVLGPNGSGKTTLQRALAGLRPIDTGRIELDGRVLDEPAAGVFVPPEERSVGVVFQQHALFGHLSALDNVAFGLRARRVATDVARRRASALLDQLDLTAVKEFKPSKLSGGQSQRVALARALAVDPQLLLLDEPLSALDVDTKRTVRRDLRKHLTTFDGVAVLITHDPVDVYALADRVAVLDHGAVVQVGSVAEITARPRTPFVAALVGTNLVSGDVAHERTPDGSTTTTLRARGVELAVSTDVVGPALAIVRPQSITLARPDNDGAPSTSARNTMIGTVDDVSRLGDRVRVGVSGPLHLTAEITVAALESLELRPGDDVAMAIKATDIDVEPA